MERGGANFLPPLREGAVTSFVMLPCLQKVQLQIISQLWETPPAVNNSLSTPERGFAPEDKALEQAWCQLSRHMRGRTPASCGSEGSLKAFLTRHTHHYGWAHS